MITLYHAPQSRSSRIIWLLEEIGAPYVIRPVSIYRPMTETGEPDADNPHPDKRVPALDHDGVLITESVAIVLHLCEAFPQAALAPAVGDPRRGAFLTWIAWYACELEPALFAGLSGELAESPQKRRNHEAVMHRLETTLTRVPYVTGETFSGADLLIGSALGFARQAFPSSNALDAYVTRCKERPAAVRGVALDGASGPQAGR
ncbi:glutathione S-transferase family protein [Methylobacterium sp. J-067]|uniref:glutathione S-transferase family protein n=1 Tax=Methylobacterium sp. J-067 TaxID=2836648 RepID=UPI001FB9C4C3|nr:glutathione S-transferase family protein [Methylobacterium sp. J-067]MCJ2025516.1 glutathione S-transferase family protein [Methylobacterium sp. J-067]